MGDGSMNYNKIQIVFQNRHMILSVHKFTYRIEQDLR